ncbi:(S)-coclaurine N-methyltransferase [Sesamum angolense]|uniref:(S)-coclaurine N-methyltransferase n=1 Tax=Sesamum angolense TaxID=2727404 RepID=A0AAE1W8J2_9LAMI|nr:(S)-coclaurine N-methyltransferase [Sesamum angolense]
MAEVNGRIVDTIVQAPYDATVRFMLASLERNLLPDAVVRRLTRLLLASRLRSGYRSSAELQMSDLLQFAHSLREMPIAIKTEKPKSQHYEVPTSFFKLVLGKHLKYSCCFFPDKSSTLEDAEKAMLELYCERSQIKDGQSVLDVGCGWGSLSVYIAQKYPNCQVTGICNSITQKAHIEEQCQDLQLQNVEIIVADISTFDMEASYDRIFSIEMFEDDVSIVDHWLVNGKHYAQTSEEWLKRMDQNLNSIKPIMESTYGKDSAVKWTVYWRTFFIAVAELFGYNNGEEWMVAHFLFKKK